MIIGLTGPTGAGKSCLRVIAEDLGFKVIDCDIIARKATEKGADSLKALVKVFGDDILESDGSLNRKALAKKAFATKENTELLNKTIFPFITELVKKEITCDKVILDAPTLFESGINSMCDTVIAVTAEKEIRLDRIIKRDNIDKESALLRINAGKTDDFYLKNADYLIYNNGENNVFALEFKEILTKILCEEN